MSVFWPQHYAPATFLSREACPHQHTIAFPTGKYQAESISEDVHVIDCGYTAELHPKGFTTLKVIQMCSLSVCIPFSAAIILPSSTKLAQNSVMAVSIRNAEALFVEASPPTCCRNRITKLASPLLHSLNQWRIFLWRNKDGQDQGFFQRWFLLHLTLCGRTKFF